MESRGTSAFLHSLTEKEEPRREIRYSKEEIFMSINWGGEGKKKRTENYSLDLTTGNFS